VTWAGERVDVGRAGAVERVAGGLVLDGRAVVPVHVRAPRAWVAFVPADSQAALRD
jgi:hypothetical protein